MAIPLFLVQPTLFLGIFYFLVGLQQTATRFLTALALVVLLVQDVIGLGKLKTTFFSPQSSVGSSLWDLSKPRGGGQSLSLQLPLLTE